MQNLGIQSVVPKDDAHRATLRMGFLTSTEIYTLVGGKCSWLSFRTLFNQKVTGILKPRVVNDSMRKGLEFEPIVAKAVAAIRGWAVEPDPKFYWNPDLRLGTSVDWRFRHIPAFDEVKTVWNEWAWRKAWRVVNRVVTQATPYVEWQLQHQMLVTGTREIFLSVRGPMGELAWGRREANAGMQRIILDKAKDLWVAVDKARAKTPTPSETMAEWAKQDLLVVA